MTILLVDIGNTRSKWALVEDGKIVKKDHFLPTCDKGALNQVLFSLPMPSVVAYISVGKKEIAKEFCRQLKRHWITEIVELRVSEKNAGVRNGYHEPTFLGIDRWAAIIGAWVPGYRTCIADCGTATTIDYVDAEGNHLGGYILPGRSMMRDALYRGTAGIIRDELNMETTLALGRDTGAAVNAGCDRATISLLNDVWSDYCDAATPCLAVLTGGAAPILHPLLVGCWCLDPDVIFKGMLRLLEDDLR